MVHHMVMCMIQELAEIAGDSEKVQEYSQLLEELEERAVELDRRRTSNISSVR